MKSLLIALSLVTLSIAFAPTASADLPCAAGQADRCWVQFVTCVTASCPPRINILKGPQQTIDDLLPGYCEPPFECYP